MRVSSISVILMLGVLWSACDVLEQRPVSEITQESYWQEAGDAQAAVIAGYDMLQSALNPELLHWGEGRTDAVTASFHTGASEQALLTNALTQDNNYTDWGDLYRVINQANLIVKYVPEMGLDEALREQFVGEAYFLRALSYYYAVRLWGDLPLLLEPYSGNRETSLIRDSRETVLDQIGEDIQAAVSRLPEAYGSTTETKGRATSYAAKALQTDYFLWRGMNEEAAAAAQEVLSGPFELVEGENYATIFSEENSAESIFELQWDYGWQEENRFGAQLLHGSSIPERDFGGTAQYYVSEDLQDALVPEDLRASVVAMDGQATTGEFVVFFPKYWGQGDPPTKIFDDNLIIYRLADVILMRAEALNNLGRTGDAVALLNQIRDRAGLPPTEASTQEQVKQAILAERLIEFAVEGKRWFDLLRTGTALGKTIISDQDHLLWPLSTRALRVDPRDELQQNPGY